MVIARGEKGSNLFSALVAGLAMVLVGVVRFAPVDAYLRPRFTPLHFHRRGGTLRREFTQV